MKKTLILAASALTLGGIASAAPINPDTLACIAEVNKTVEAATSYDAFIPTQFLDTARVIDWKSPYSEGNAVPVVTMVVIEGIARERDDHDDTEKVTIKCGMDMGTVRAVEIVQGHNVKIRAPITASEQN